MDAKLDASEKALVCQPPGTWSFTDTGKKSRVGSWTCAVHRAERAGTTIEVCLVPWSTAPVAPSELECLVPLQRLMSATKSEPAADIMYEDLARFPGLVVEARQQHGGGVVVTTLKTARREKIAAELFAVPPDYELRMSIGMGQ